jgi:hypothetical protein
MTGAPRDRRLPLAVAGSLSNGWWGTLSMLLVLAVALATLVASYFYLAPRWPATASPDTTETLVAGALIFVALATAAVTLWSVRGGTLEALARRQLGLALAFLLGLIAVGMLWVLYRYHETTYTRAIDAEGSFFYVLIMFQLVVTLIHLMLVAAAQLWAWRAPSDPRGLAPAANAALVGYFLVGSSAIVCATLYLSPRLLQRI